MQRPYETPVSLQAYVGQQPLHLTPIDFNQSVVELFLCQTELAHSTQHLHQQMMDALDNIARSSTFKENQHFINDIPNFKAEDPQSFDHRLEQIDEVAALTNKDTL